MELSAEIPRIHGHPNVIAAFLMPFFRLLKLHLEEIECNRVFADMT